MITRLFNRSSPHEHEDPEQRRLAVADLDPASEELAQLLQRDPEPGVRSAAAERCSDIQLLEAALRDDADDAVRAAAARSLGRILASTPEASVVHVRAEAGALPDAVWVEVARHSDDAERRRIAIAALRDEDALAELAIDAELAETRLAAADRVVSEAALQRIDDATRNKDHGVHRLVHQRLEAIRQRHDETIEADAILDQLEALVEKPGAILTEVVELNRRWQALDMSADPARLARCDAARRRIQARMDREQDEQRAQTRLRAQVREWAAALTAPQDAVALEALRARLEELRAQASALADTVANAELDATAEKMVTWAEHLSALAPAEALVVEAEQLAAGTYIDNAKLPERWQALSREIRTPELTRRFEAALMMVEQRRIAHVQAAQQEAGAIRQRIHALLHAAEQALNAGQLREARAAVDEIKPLRPAAGTLPKPTLSRIGRVQQQVGEMERWQSFGQQSARVQLCERAEAASAITDPRKLAQDVQALRNEWKTLDQQYAGVPKALWERFDKACEKAYAPAARYFAELGAQRKESRKQREEFIAAAEAHAPTLLGESPDWRAIERWLREIDQKWREGDLGSLEPQAWKRLDAKLKAALAPLREALTGAREQAKAARQALIAEATALGSAALDRETPSKVKAIQARWQEHAKSFNLPQRDERALWEQFRSACDAVFKSREAKRKEDDGRKGEQRRALEEICEQIEQLARMTDKSEQELRRSLREYQDRWRKESAQMADAARALEPRFRKARSAVENAISARERARGQAIWDNLFAKEQLCESLDASVLADAGESAAADVSASVRAQWEALPALTGSWEKLLLARRDAALAALADPAAAAAYRKRIDAERESRREGLLELELQLGLESPPELQQQRLALQVKQLRDRFKNTAATGSETAGDRLCAWCAKPGVIDADDRRRSERVFAAVRRQR